MRYLKIDYIKQHSRIDYDCEDALLELYGEAAEETMAQYLNRGKTADEMVADLKSVYGRVPAPIIHATLMLVDVSYQYRSPVSPTNIAVVPYTFDILVKPYMRLADYEEKPEPEPNPDNDGIQ